MERRFVPLKGCFAGATLVITRDGPVPIRDLVAIEAEFLSTSSDPCEGNAEPKWVRTQVQVNETNPASVHADQCPASRARGGWFDGNEQATVRAHPRRPAHRVAAQVGVRRGRF